MGNGVIIQQRPDFQASPADDGQYFESLHPRQVADEPSLYEHKLLEHRRRIRRRCCGHAAPEPPPRCVTGVERGQTVENSFELLYDPATATGFPLEEAGAIDAEESDIHILKALMDCNENPVYVLNHAINHAPKDLPMTIYESEAERISVDHVAQLKPSDGGSTATQCKLLCPCSVVLSTVLACWLLTLPAYTIAIKMLSSRIRVLHHYLVAMQKAPLDNNCTLSRVKTSSSQYILEYGDTLLITYLAMFSRARQGVFFQGGDISSIIKNCPHLASDCIEGWFKECILHAVWWFVWLERNQRVFKEKSSTTYVVANRATRNTMEWLVAHGKVERGLV
ncbi:unnamed protein product [Linum tenue]|uniref:Uncharacterized protein n=1 Tax=Linum tenue TaxID=586396 RepID=A0AAV0IP70_9ROSI|nr:unnamed protein product [Linum tenue]